MSDAHYGTEGGAERLAEMPAILGGVVAILSLLE